MTDRSFDVRIINLLLMHGAKVSEVNLAQLFTATLAGASTDRYNIFSNIAENKKQNAFRGRKLKRRGRKGNKMTASRGT